MNRYRICELCGAALDPGELCDCRPAVPLKLIQPEESPVDGNVLACPRCGSGEHLHDPDEAPNRLCGQCGQPLEWGRT